MNNHTFAVDLHVKDLYQDEPIFQIFETLSGRPVFLLGDSACDFEANGQRPNEIIKYACQNKGCE